MHTPSCYKTYRRPLFVQQFLVMDNAASSLSILVYWLAMGNSNVYQCSWTKNQKLLSSCRQGCCSLCCSQWLKDFALVVHVITNHILRWRLLPVCIGYVSQLMTKIIPIYWVRIYILEDPDHDGNNNTQYCQLKCKGNKEFVTGLLISDAILVILSVWAYCALNFWYPLCQRFGCKGFKAVATEGRYNRRS